MQTHVLRALESVRSEPSLLNVWRGEQWDAALALFGRGPQPRRHPAVRHPGGAERNGLSRFIDERGCRSQPVA